MKLPRRELTNIDLIKFAQKLRIPHFRGVFMRDELPLKIGENESGIVNLDNASGPGTHWTAYTKNRNMIIYFDSFGNLRPPTALTKYFLSDGSNNIIKYNHDKFQKDKAINCGHLCLKFLYNTYN